MKAIETSYAGCRFRSRLEARWAVFFDTLGVRWEYEPQGFELGDGIRYLPDFWLPKHRIWFEVKGELTPIDTKWRQFHDTIHDPSFGWHDSYVTAKRTFNRITEAARKAAMAPYVKVCDSKHDPCFCADCMAAVERQAEVIQRNEARRLLPDRTFLAGPIPHLTETNHRYDFSTMIGPGSPHSGWAWSECANCGDIDACHVAWPVPLLCGHESDDPLVNTPRLRAAYHAARSARFEHGETGRRVSLRPDDVTIRTRHVGKG